jgi:hypothetical protein
MTGKRARREGERWALFFLLTENHLSKLQIKEKIAIFE